MREDGELLLSNQLCFLVHRLDRAIIGKYKELLDALGLTYPQYLAMLVLWEREELGVGELCEALYLDTGTVSPLVKRMQAMGLVEKARRPDDERAVALKLTAKGRGLKEKAKSVPRAMASCLLADAEDYRSLRATLGALLDRLEG